MKFLESLFFGFISGLAEFLPISSPAHQKIIDTVFGVGYADPVRNLFVHTATLVALYLGTAKARERINKAAQSRSRNKNENTSKAMAEYRLLRSVTIPFLIVFFLIHYMLPATVSLIIVALCLFLNGIAIFLPERMLQGNKNAKVMTKLDGALIGILGALSALPGFSRVGVMYSIFSMRGAERKSAVNWALLLSVPALVGWIILDLFSLFSGNALPFWSNVFYYIFSALFAFLGARFGIYVLRRYIRNDGSSGYAFYCWGAALFSLILFLTIA